MQACTVQEHTRLTQSIVCSVCSHKVNIMGHAWMDGTVSNWFNNNRSQECSVTKDEYRGCKTT